MATTYNTITIPPSGNTPHEILRLNTPHLGSFEEEFESWEQQITNPPGGSAEMGTEMGGMGNMAMDMGMDMGTGLMMGGHGMDVYDHDLNFEGDGGLLDSMTSIPFTPTYDLDTFSSTFEDPFSYQSEAFSIPQKLVPDPSPATTEPLGESKEANPDNKLLSFGPPVSDCAIFTSAGTQTWPTMTAELYGMFFVAEDVFGDSLPAPGRPTELTCYRRNLFQLSGSFTMSRGIKSFVNEQGQSSPLSDLSATLTAVESIEGKPTDIISVPWKSSQPTPGAPSEDTAPVKIPLDLSLNPELDPAVVSIPVAWKRLQFKHATANNGRRKGLQQHYVIKIGLVGTLQSGELVKLAEIQSGPIIVRGRSPRNFDSRKDVNLAAGERKVEGKARILDSGREPPLKVDPGVTNGSYKFYALNALQQPLDLADWNTPSAAPAPLPSPTVSETHRAKRASVSHASASTATVRPPVPKTRWGSDVSPAKPAPTQKFAPIDLSIADEGRSSSTVSRSLSIGGASPKIERVGSVPTVKKALVGSPVENADLLYEYFPLSLDDWMPPVDAIYRPHVVHHTNLPPDLKAEQVRNKQKRYFSADD